MVLEEIAFEEINIKDIDKDFIRSIELGDLYAFITFVKNYRSKGSYAKARKVNIESTRNNHLPYHI